MRNKYFIIIIVVIIIIIIIIIIQNSKDKISSAIKLYNTGKNTETEV